MPVVLIILACFASFMVGVMSVLNTVTPIQSSAMYYQSEEKCTANTYKPCKTVYLKAYVTK
ncbi:hypothetical protein [Vibrio phage BUCT194]|uniref:Uncharacterized protein n=1 Tax=Vibrio phage BUCT194 TaxID=2859072 RepID=A0AAE8XFR6_9CAUD|nr:hypothetical protein PP741_gp011 [Vibrio phage BUCT194]UAW01118.1 hypothetical protein [Vibrio phage BUCT194]